MYLVFDIETTGLVKCKKFGVYPDFRDNIKYDTARIVQIAWLVLDEQFNTIEERNYIVKRDQFIITNSNFHGITNHISDIKGVPFYIIMADFMLAVQKSKMIIAHNIQFDFNVMLNHLYRYNNYPLFSLLIKKQRFCTSFESANLLKIKMHYETDFYKLPSLQELYTYYFNEEIKDPHNALSDTIACAECFKRLIYDISYIPSISKILIKHGIPYTPYLSENQPFNPSINPAINSAINQVIDPIIDSNNMPIINPNNMSIINPNNMPIINTIIDPIFNQTITQSFSQSIIHTSDQNDINIPYVTPGMLHIYNQDPYITRQNSFAPYSQQVVYNDNIGNAQNTGYVNNVQLLNNVQNIENPQTMPYILPSYFPQYM